LDELSEKLIEVAVKETIQPIYKDTLSPALNEIGKIGYDAVKTIRLFTAPIQYGAYLQTRLEKHLEKALKNISKEEMVKPHNAIQMPIFEELKNYDIEEQYNEKVISEMYQNLLSSAYDKNTSTLVHPRFVRIVADLSPDEAILFNYICHGKSSTSDFKYLGSLVEKVENKEYLKIYFNNLEQLGLIKIHNYNAIMYSEPEIGIMVINDKIYEPTEFGLLFYNIVNKK